MASNSQNSSSSSFSYNKYKSNKSYAKQVRKAEKNQPKYSNPYKGELNKALKQIDNGAFGFDAAASPVYQQYSNDYRLLGNIAAESNAATTEGLSGGYGTTYSGTVADQQLQGYLANEKNIIPALYQQEKANYYSDQANAINRANLANQLDAQKYNEFLAKLNAWNQNREYNYNKWYNDYLANSTTTTTGRTNTNSTTTREVVDRVRTNNNKSKYSNITAEALSSRAGALAYLTNNHLDAGNVMDKEQFQEENAKRGYKSYAGGTLSKGDQFYNEANARDLDNDYADYLLDYIRQAQGQGNDDWFTKTQKKYNKRFR